MKIKNVAAVLSGKTGIPVELIANELRRDSNSRMEGLRNRLALRVIGQDVAIKSVCDRLMLAQAELLDRRGPLGVFLFMGPSGVGKTELARALADALFGSEKSMIRLDMSEYMEKHNVARLIGSPPGYIGHDEEGQLTEALRRAPYSIVLLDEIEKAHPQVADLFLQVFDDGRVTDAKGGSVDAKNSIFIMTSNLGVESSVKLKQMGFNALAAPALAKASARENDVLKKYFRPEMINRIDEVIVFEQLDIKVVEQIAEKRMEMLALTLKEKHNVTLTYDKKVIEFLCAAGFNAEFGARELARVIQRYIEMPLAGLLAAQSKSDACHIRCIAENDGVIISFQ